MMLKVSPRALLPIPFHAHRLAPKCVLSPHSPARQDIKHQMVIEASENEMAVAQRDAQIERLQALIGHRVERLDLNTLESSVCRPSP